MGVLVVEGAKAQMKLESWDFDVLGVYNPMRVGHLESWFRILRDEVSSVPGDVVEAGVFQGRSLLAAAYVLRETSPDKTIFGFDSFGGFPPVGLDVDQPEEFHRQFERGEISADHLDRVNRNMAHLKHRNQEEEINHLNVSSSGSFTETSAESILSKAKYLGLTNVQLVEGDFSQTMAEEATQVGKISAAIIDCDLFESYITTFEFLWPRLSVGGFVYLDEYYSLKFPGARVATQKFFQGKNVEFHHVQDSFNGFERWWVKRTGL